MTNEYQIKISTLSSTELPHHMFDGMEMSYNEENFRSLLKLIESNVKEHGGLVCVDVTIYQPNYITEGYVIFKDNHSHWVGI